MDLVAAIKDWAVQLVEPLKAPGAGGAGGPLTDAVQRSVQLAEAISSFDTSASSLDALIEVTELVGRLVTTLGETATAASEAFDWDASGGDFVEELVGLLVGRFLSERAPAALEVASLLSLTDESGALGLRKLDLTRLPRLIEDPAATLIDFYVGPAPPTNPAEAEMVADVSFTRIGALVSALGLQAEYVRATGRSVSVPANFPHPERALWIPFPSVAGAGLLLSTQGEGEDDAAIVLGALAGASASIGGQRWSTTVEVGGSSGWVAIGPNGITGSDPQPSFFVKLTATLGPSTAGPLFRTSASGTRLEIGGLVLSGMVTVDTGWHPGIELQLVDFGLVANGGDGDGFLDQILGGDLGGKQTVAVGWDRERGLYVGAGAGLEARLPLPPIGPVTPTDAVVALSPTAEKVDISLALGISAQLGPLTASVDRFGLGLTLAFPAGRGNLGPLDLGASIVPPTGVSLSIDAGAVTGGGFLFFDPVKEQYAGALHLEVEGGLTLSAFGLLTTRMPDGSPGFSLLILVQASGFAPIQLGFGFTLTGVGGLLGVNRTVDVEVLQTGLRNRTLDAILFSQEDPTPRAPQIVSTLQSVFPPAPDQYVLGPMVQITWGPPPDPVLTIEVALVLELPAPLRLVILGRVQASLPTLDHPVVKLRLDVVGVIDFDRRHLAIDATLYDSFIGPFALTGDMAARGSWGDQPDFAVALGGFHPAFRPPEGFPQLRRLALTLSSGDNPRLRMEAYLALTSNTVQIGARLDFYVAAAGFALEGGFGFDTLITLSPLRLQAEIEAGLTLKRGSTTLAHLGVHVNLVGPSPWEVWGTATLSILFLDISVPFHATFGEPQALPEPERVDVWILLKAQLAHPDNWATALPPEDNRLATLVAPPGQAHALVHPLGAVSVTQRLVPLERTLSLFGTAPPAEANFFEITGSAELVQGEDVYDYFAPAQFRRMSDAEKLSSPSFDRMVSGATFGPRLDDVTIGTVAVAPLDYETALVVDLEDPTRLQSEAYRPPGDTVATVAGRGPAALAEMRDQGRDKFAPPVPGPALAEPEYVVATQDTLAEGVDGHDGTYSGAVEALRLRPDAERFQIVRREEVELAAL